MTDETVKITIELPLFSAGLLAGSMVDRGWMEAAEMIYQQAKGQTLPIPEIKNKYAVVEDDAENIWVLVDDDEIPWKLHRGGSRSRAGEWSAWEAMDAGAMQTVVKVHYFGIQP